MGEKIIAYIDLMGFKSQVEENINIAHESLVDIQVILQQKELSQTIKSFNNFLPFSDSIIITSEKDKADDFVIQLSSFLVDACNLNLNKIKEEWNPLLFRGGISFGEAQIINENSKKPSEPSNAILNNIVCTMPNVIGKAYSKTVLMEQSLKGKGFRLLCDKNFFDLYKDKVNKKYIKPPIGGSYYEILWPAYYFYAAKSYENKLTDFFREFLKPIINLWNLYEIYKSDLSNHYFDFLLLIIESLIPVFKGNRLDEVKQNLKKIIDDFSCDSARKTYLMNFVDCLASIS